LLPGRTALRPIPAEDFSALVGSIYDCALDPALWPDVLTALCREMDFRMSSLILAAQPYDRTLLDITVGITAEERAGMLAFGRAAVEAWGPPGTLGALPLETPCVRSAVNPRAAETRYVREACLPLGLFDNVSIMFSRDSAAFSVLSFGRHVDEGPVGADELATARLFIPHLKRALVIGRLLEARAVERATYREVLDALAVAVLLVGPDLGLLHANRTGEALLRAGHPLGLRHGRVTAPAGLAAALAAALAAPAGGIGRRGLGIPARRSDGEEMVIHLLPLAAASPLQGAAAALFVAPAIHPRPAPLDAIAALFDLTPTEARVLELAGAGRSNAEIAVALGTAISTVRTHLLKVFEKTGTHRRTDLVALLAAFSLPLA
ncbi:MAG TPA: helix-turn-helix transcriptional regulator, partial [Amaricoccus sp.]|nr:helix-turn-helix transcriptional regulator [Amaricoccus sp.]